MAIKLKKQTIEIFKALKEKNADCEASDLANELNIDYIVLMAAINDLIDVNLGSFKEDEIVQLSLNKEGLSYIKNGLPERQLLDILIKRNIKEIEMPDPKSIDFEKVTKQTFKLIQSFKLHSHFKISSVPDKRRTKYIEKVKKKLRENYSDKLKRVDYLYYLIHKRN